MYMLICFLKLYHHNRYVVSNCLFAPVGVGGLFIFWLFLLLFCCHDGAAKLCLKQLQKNNALLYSILDDVYGQKLHKDTNILGYFN